MVAPSSFLTPRRASSPESPRRAENTLVLYYYGYRYYDPNTGTWPSRDPMSVTKPYAESPYDWGILVGEGEGKRFVALSDIFEHIPYESLVSANLYILLKNNATDQYDHDGQIFGIFGYLAAGGIAYGVIRGLEHLADAHTRRQESELLRENSLSQLIEGNNIEGAIESDEEAREALRDACESSAEAAGSFPGLSTGATPPGLPQNNVEGAGFVVEEIIRRVGSE